MLPIPDHLDEIDLAWMSRALGSRLEAMTRLPGPAGFGATSQIGRFALEGDGPARVTVKIGRAGHPHPSMFRREVRSYRELALPAPRCHVAVTVDDAFVLVLEDLGHAHHPRSGARHDQARALLSTLGRWHHQHRAPVDGWPTKELPDGLAHQEAVRGGLERPDRPRFGVTPATERALRALIDGLPGALGDLAASARGLLHSDLHAENVLFDEQRVVLLDWQNTACGPLAIDVAGALTCIAPEVLDKDGDALLDDYHATVGTPRDDAALRGAVGFVSYTIPWLADHAATSARAPLAIDAHWQRLAAAIRFTWGRTG
ncbi:MAG: phosphotransferase [Myxococcota bacterium]